MSIRANQRIQMKEADAWIQRIAQWGYWDAQADLGFRPEYDLMNEREQLAYETGRFWASNIKAAQIKPPRWRNGEAQPKRLTAADTAATMLVGSAIPWG